MRHQRLFFGSTVGHRELSVEYHHLKLRQFCPQTGRNGHYALFTVLTITPAQPPSRKALRQSVSQLFLGRRMSPSA